MCTLVKAINFAQSGFLMSLINYIFFKEENNTLYYIGNIVQTLKFTLRALIVLKLPLISDKQCMMWLLYIFEHVHYIKF